MMIRFVSDATGEHMTTRRIESRWRDALISLLSGNAGLFDVEDRSKEATVRRGKTSIAEPAVLVKIYKHRMIKWTNLIELSLRTTLD